MLKYYDGDYYLLTVNIDGVPVEAKFVLPFVVTNVEVMFEDRAPRSRRLRHRRRVLPVRRQRLQDRARRMRPED